jgi:hypothetical protein
VALMLSQPANRTRLLVIKATVLAMTLLALVAVAVAVDYNAPQFAGAPGRSLTFTLDREPASAVLWLPVAWALFVAPWLTLLCGSAIAGTVFTLALAGMLLVAGDMLGVRIYPLASQVDRFRMTLLWQGTVGLSAIGAVMAWRAVLRLEAIEVVWPDVRLPQFLRRSVLADSPSPALTRRHPLWRLVQKELRLQQLTFAVAAVFAFGWLAVTFFDPPAPRAGDALAGLTGFYSVLVAMLAGSLASAEERQLGTIEWQLLLPVATRVQWMIKVATTAAVAMLLGLGVPALLALNDPGGHIRQLLRPEFAIVLALLTAVSLLVSSLCTSGLRALVWSLPALVAMSLLTGFIAAMTRGRLHVLSAPSLAMEALFLAVTLRIAMANHCAATRPAV